MRRRVNFPGHQRFFTAKRLHFGIRGRTSSQITGRMYGSKWYVCCTADNMQELSTIPISTLTSQIPVSCTRGPTVHAVGCAPSSENVNSLAQSESTRAQVHGPFSCEMVNILR